MAITGTGTGPFTITGTETSTSIYTYVFAQNPANATKNATSTQFDFNCILLVGDGTQSTSWTSTEEMVRINAASFEVRVNATLTLGIINPARAGSYWRFQMTANNQLVIRGTWRAYASRIYASHRAVAFTGATCYFEECNLALLDSIDPGGGNPTFSYIRCFVAGASGVGMKVAGTFTYTSSKVSGTTFSFQPLPTAGAPGTYTVTDYIGSSNSFDFVGNTANAGTLNIVGAFDVSGAPKSTLVPAGTSPGTTIAFRWRYNLTALSGGAALASAVVRIRNVGGTDVFTGTTNGSGVIAQQTITRTTWVIGVGSNSYPYAIRVRKYDVSSQDLTWNCDNHTTQQTAHVALANLALSQAAAAALTGIAFAPSGATGGTVTVTQNRTIAEVWASYRNWIATLANFNSDDTWTFGLASMSIAAWNITVSGVTLSMASNQDFGAAGVISASMTTGGAYTYTGTLSGSSVTPSFTGGTLSIGAAGWYVFNSDGTIVQMTPTAPGTYILTGAQAGTMDLRNLAAHAITVQVPAGTATTTASNVGGTITVTNPPITHTLSIPPLPDGTRVLVKNGASVIANALVSGGAGYTLVLTQGIDYTPGDTIRWGAFYATGTTYYRPKVGSFIAGSGTAAFNDALLVWAYPTAVGLDWTAVTECATDYVNVEIDVDDPDNIGYKSRYAVFITGAMLEAGGIEAWLDLTTGTAVIDWISPVAVSINAFISPVTVKNSKAASKLSVKDDFAFHWSDGVDRVDCVIGSSIIWQNPLEVALDTASAADAILDRSIAGGADGGRTVRQALQAMRNRVRINGSTLTVYGEDDTTPAWTAEITTAQRDAINEVNPV